MGHPRRTSTLFRNYLFVEFREHLTLDICRATTKFIKVIKTHDDDGKLVPLLVRRNHIEENKAMVLAGKFNERSLQRKFHGQGSTVRVIEGSFIDKRVRLEADILPTMKGNYRVPVDINGIKAKIEIFKLAI
jgi:hypothetical protein